MESGNLYTVVTRGLTQAINTLIEELDSAKVKTYAYTYNVVVDVLGKFLHTIRIAYKFLQVI